MSKLTLVASCVAPGRAVRKSLLRAVTLSVDGVERRAIIRNISDTGAMVETDLLLVKGQAISVELPVVGTRRGEVRWVIGRRAGIEFTEVVSLVSDGDHRLAALNAG